MYLSQLVTQITQLPETLHTYKTLIFAVIFYAKQHQIKDQSSFDLLISYFRACRAR